MIKSIILQHLQGVYSVALGRSILVSGGEDSKVNFILLFDIFCMEAFSNLFPRFAFGVGNLVRSC